MRWRRPTETEPNGGVSVVINAAMVMGKNVDFVMTLYRNGEEMPVAQVGGQLTENERGQAYPAEAQRNRS